MATATKDSYSRVYAEDDTYTYLKLPDNQLRRKGEQYFENWEITGSKKSDGQGNNKFPLRS